MQLLREPIQGEDYTLAIRALGLEPCTQKHDAQCVAVLVLALAAAVGCVLLWARAPPVLEAVVVGPHGAVPRQAHGCTSGPSHSPSKHSRHLLSSSSSRARLRWARVSGAMRFIGAVLPPTRRACRVVVKFGGALPADDTRGLRDNYGPPPQLVGRPAWRCGATSRRLPPHAPPSLAYPTLARLAQGLSVVRCLTPSAAKLARFAGVRGADVLDVLDAEAHGGPVSAASHLRCEGRHRDDADDAPDAGRRRLRLQRARRLGDDHGRDYHAANSGLDDEQGDPALPGHGVRRGGRGPRRRLRPRAAAVAGGGEGRRGPCGRLCHGPAQLAVEPQPQPSPSPSPLTAHRSPLTTHHSPLTFHPHPHQVLLNWLSTRPEYAAWQYSLFLSN
eukprot:scaffold12297_cov57-Phaeocystis_antarctica.AAC.2